MSSLLACVKTSTLVAGAISALESVHRHEDSAGPEAPEAPEALAVAAVASENRGVNQVGPAKSCTTKRGLKPYEQWDVCHLYQLVHFFFINSTLSPW